MKQATTLLLAFVISFNTFSQVKIFGCSYYGERATLTRFDVCLRNNSFAFGELQDDRAEKMVDRIMAEVGLPRNFLLVECPAIDNCHAVNYLAETGSLRYIVYDDAFMRGLDSMAATKEEYWASISIMAHEIGHHLCGHTLDSLGSRPDKELEADEFSGFIMYKLGATLQQAQAGMTAITKEYGDVQIVSTHPPLANRLAAIRSGWNKGWSSNYRQQQNKNDKPSLIAWEEIAQEVYNDAYLLNKTGKYEQAIQKLNVAIHLKKDYANAFIQRGYAEASLNKKADAFKSLDSALLIEPGLYLATVYKGKACVNAKQYLQAEALFAEAIKNNQFNGAAYAERAIMWKERGLYDKAIADATMAILNDYQDAHIPLGILGYANMKKKKYDDAIGYFAKALKYNPLDAFSMKWGQETIKLIKIEELKKPIPVKKPVVKPSTKNNN